MNNNADEKVHDPQPLDDKMSISDPEADPVSLAQREQLAADRIAEAMAIVEVDQILGTLEGRDRLLRAFRRRKLQRRKQRLN
jgi:hypothetical protein